MENGKEVKSWAAHAGSATSLEFARDATKLASVGRDRLTKIGTLTERRLCSFRRWATSPRRSQ